MSRTKKISLRLRRAVRNLSSRTMLAGLALMEALIFLLDVDTGPSISFAPFLCVPTALAAWFLGVRTTLCFVVLSTAARVYDYHITRARYESVWMVGYDLLQSAVFYGIIVLLVMWVRSTVDRLAERALSFKRTARRERHRRMMESTIRRAVPEDVDTIVRLTASGGESGSFDQVVTDGVRQAALAASFKAGIIDGAALRDLWTGGQSTVPIEFWVSEIDGKVVSYMMILGVDGQKGTPRELHAMVVDDSCRGRNIGSMMVDFFCTHYKQRRLVAGCRSDSLMTHMLERRGFQLHSRADSGYDILVRD